MMAEEFGYEHPWQVPPSMVEPRVQTYWMTNVFADQLRPENARGCAEAKTA